MKITEINYHNNQFHLIECKFVPNFIERFFGKKEKTEIIRVRGGLRDEYLGRLMDLYYTNGKYISKLNPIHIQVTRWFASEENEVKSEEVHKELRAKYNLK